MQKYKFIKRPLIVFAILTLLFITFIVPRIVDGLFWIGNFHPLVSTHLSSGDMLAHVGSVISLIATIVLGWIVYVQADKIAKTEVQVAKNNMKNDTYNFLSIKSIEMSSSARPQIQDLPTWDKNIDGGRLVLSYPSDKTINAPDYNAAIYLNLAMEGHALKEVPLEEVEVYSVDFEVDDNKYHSFAKKDFNTPQVVIKLNKWFETKNGGMVLTSNRDDHCHKFDLLICVLYNKETQDLLGILESDKNCKISIQTTLSYVNILKVRTRCHNELSLSVKSRKLAKELYDPHRFVLSVDNEKIMGFSMDIKEDE